MAAPTLVRNGMLEVSSLLLQPETSLDSRPIVDAVSGQILGFARWREVTGWWGWFHGRTMEIREEDDAPLLCTVRRSWKWSARQQVFDAEGFVVGALIGRFILNEFNRRIAVRQSLNDGQTSLENLKGEALAMLENGAGGLRLDFRPEVSGDPFLKMLLLTAALTWDWPNSDVG